MLVVTLSAPAGPGGVSVQFSATADGTALAGEDYETLDSGAGIAAGETTMSVGIFR
jgi:hypothetical protein